MGRFAVEFKLSNNADITLARHGLLPPEQVRQVTIRGVVDTGATRLVIPARIAEQLGAREVGETQVRYGDNRTATRKLVDDVLVELLDRQATFRAAVEPELRGTDCFVPRNSVPRNTSALIGTFVLEELDFVVDCVTQTLRPRDPKHIISEIE